MSSEFTPAEHQQQPAPEPWAASFWDSRFFLLADSSLLLVVIGVVLIPFLGVAGLILAVFSALLGIAALLGIVSDMMDAAGAPVAEDAGVPSHSHEHMHQ
jgi:hypothetical protein